MTGGAQWRATLGAIGGLAVLAAASAAMPASGSVLASGAVPVSGAVVAVWRPAPQPAALRGASSGLVAVSCPSATDCVGVGSMSPSSGSLSGEGEPLIESWDGHRWSVVSQTGAAFPSGVGHIGTAASFAGVSCLPGGWCVAVGSNESSSEMAPVIDMRAAGRWRVAADAVMANGPGGALDAVSCVTPSMCIAVGDVVLGGGSVPLIQRWDGRTWSRLAPASGPSSGETTLTGVACTSARSCTAVGERASFDPLEETTVIEDWDGSTWSVVPSPDPGVVGSGLAAVSCRTATACTAVGAEGGLTAGARPLIETSAGSRWTVDPVHLEGPDHSTLLDGVSCGSPPFCVVVGFTQQSRFGTSSVPLVLRTAPAPVQQAPVQQAPVQQAPVQPVTVEQVTIAGSAGRGSLLRAVACDPVLICTATGTTLGDTAALVISDDAPIGPRRSSFPLLPVSIAVVVVLVTAALRVRRRRRSRPGSPEGGTPGADQQPTTATPPAPPVPPAPPEDPTVWAPSGDGTRAPPPPPAEPPPWTDDPDDSAQWAPPGR